jgi:glucan phosphoethanolaminetransferase (alkaline phosphatase superfamily)
MIEPPERPSVRAFWQSSAPTRAFQFYIATHLLLSFGYMYFFCRHFGFSRRLAILHLSTLFGPTLAVALAAGTLAMLSRHRSRRLAAYLVASLYALWSSILALLYLAHFVGNSLWGNNVNYELVSRFLLRRRIAVDDGLSLSTGTSLVLLAAVLAIVAVHFALSSKLLAGLEHIFGRERPSSVFHGRSRAIKASLVLGMVFTGYGVYVHTLPAYLSAEWSVELEPIASFFQLDLYDTRHTALADRLRIEEPKARAAYPTGQTFKKKNVIVMIVDSLRADHMQVYGYQRPTTPFLSGLQNEGRLKRVDLATSTCAESNCGILSTLASKTLPGLIPEDFKLHDLLHDQGYQTYFILSGDHEWFGLKKSYGKDLTLFTDNTTSDVYRGIADDRILLEGLDKVPDYEGTPGFFYFHLMSVHISGIKHPEFRKYQPADVGRDWDALIHGEYDVASLVNSYDNGVIEADAIIKELFETLKRKGFLEQSLVVILSDHGEGLGDRGTKDFGHVKWLYQEYIKIPLLIYDDAAPFAGRLEYATQIDVAPTIVDSLGLAIPASWQGQSLLKPDHREFTFHQTSLMNASFSVLYRHQNSIFQYLFRPQNRREELYELRSDPGEANNLMSSADPAMVTEFRRRLEQYRSQN